jgi:phenylacetic acid degradation operon negative regulatory protein
MSQTQNLILRIVAQRQEIRSGELLEVAQKFGRSPDAVRAATNRMTRAGLLTKTRQGRGNLLYRIGLQGQAFISQFIVKLLRWHVTLEGQLTWDGNWLVVTFSIPENQRSKRDVFRTRLIEMGFGLLSSSVWISPLNQEAEVTALAEELGLTGQVTLLRCQFIRMPGVESVAALAYRVWKLEALETHYRNFSSHVEALLESLERVKQGKKVDAEALFFQALDFQSELLDIIFAEDPCLPVELLRPDWPGQHAHKLIHALTHTIDYLNLVNTRYEYLLYVIPGMEALEVFRSEDDGFRWPSEGSEKP